MLASARAILSALMSGSQIEREYCDWDRRMRGSSLNYDLYGADPERGLYIWQARQAFRARASHFMATHKTYGLAGRNEDGSPFWHPISSAIVRAAIRKAPDDMAAPVRAAEAWIFHIAPAKLPAIIRHGDVALIPARGVKAEPRAETCATLAETHVLEADTILERDGRTFAVNPRLSHTRGQHADVSARGLYEVVIGRTARAWDFSPRSAD